jgi:hypothetical protein
VDDDQDWRLQVRCDGDVSHKLLERVREADDALGHDVALTHDGNVLFAYAAARETAQAAREAIEAVLAADGVSAHATLSHWDEDREEWTQVDPPPAPADLERAAAAERDAERPESRTMVVSSGKWVRAEVEATMRAYADQLGLECEIIEHPHLLTVQVAFTVNGPHRRIEDFARALRAEELATLRTERSVMLSPL